MYSSKMGLLIFCLAILIRENFVQSSIKTPRTFAKILPGDVCQIVAPLSPGFGSTPEQLVEAVQSFGLTPLISPDIFNVSGPDPSYPWYSNSDEYRAIDFANAILSPDVKVIWLVNGGSGAFRTLEHLDKLLPPPPLPGAPKPIIGFSASTPIFAYLQQKYNWPVVHGAVLDLVVAGYYENSTEITIDPLREILFGNVDNRVILPPLMRVDGGRPWIGDLISKVVGGSMRQTTLSMGTPYKLNTTDKILFFEVSERTADSANDFVDAVLYSGTFDDVKAIVFGDFISDLLESPSYIQWVLDRLASEGKVKAPIFRVNGIGHGFTNFPVVFNTEARIRHIDGNSYSMSVSF